MSASQFDFVLHQVQRMPSDELMKLLKKVVELLEQKQTTAAPPKVDYVALIGSGKGAFASPEEADRFIREERDAWDK